MEPLKFDNMIYYNSPKKTGVSPSKGIEGDAGWDLHTSEPITIPANSFRDVPTDICIAMPDALWGRITGRSSTWRGWNLMVIEGIIDTGYRGELFVGVYNPTPNDIHIPAATRLAQLILHEHVSSVNWCSIKELPPSARGANGFGSTGK